MEEVQKVTSKVGGRKAEVTATERNKNYKFCVWDYRPTPFAAKSYLFSILRPLLA